MKVAVCCRGVPVGTSMEFIHIDNGDIHYKDTDYYINECDAYALEAALSLKNLYGADITVFTLGPLRALEVLYFALAKGVDNVFRIDGETSLPEIVAYGLIPPLKEIAPQLVLVGAQSDDWMGGEVGIYLSQSLDMGLAFAVIEIGELKDRNIRIKKEIGGGRKLEVLLTLPAVLCVQSGIQPLRYLSMLKRKKARENPVKSWGKLNIEDAKQKISGMVTYAVKEVSLPSKEGHAEMIEGDRLQRARKILELISNAV
jgi:electron transfer flavoprotein beta subunit